MQGCFDFVREIPQVEAFCARDEVAGENRGAEGVVVGPADLVRGEGGVIDFDEFVAGRKHGHAWTHSHVDDGSAHRGGHGDLAAGEACTSVHEKGSGGGIGAVAMKIGTRSESSGGGEGDDDVFA